LVYTANCREVPLPDSCNAAIAAQLFDDLIGARKQHCRNF